MPPYMHTDHTYVKGIVSTPGTFQLEFNFRLKPKAFSSEKKNPGLSGIPLRKTRSTAPRLLEGAIGNRYDNLWTLSEWQ